MYSLDQLRRGLSTPSLFFREANRRYYRALSGRAWNAEGIDIFSEDWDNLIILDACRYDAFERANPFDGELESRISRGSNTVEFLRGNVQGRTLDDTVYVTANPQFYRNRDRLDAEFHSVLNIWAEDGWDEETGTVLPETVTKRAVEAAERYPNKRLFVHYVQPHYPFIGTDTSFDKGHLDDEAEEGYNVWSKIMEGDLSIEETEIWSMYLDNLRVALRSVESLVQGLSGLTVVSSDHGNMFGERCPPFPIREWGHPRGLYTDQLVKVPWLRLEGTERREIEAEEGTGGLQGIEETAEDRLRELGYV